VLVHVLSRGPMEDIHLQLRGGHTNKRRWVVMRVTGRRATGQSRAADIDSHPDADGQSWKQAMTLLGASGLGISSIRDRTHIYGGDVHQRDNGSTVRVTLLLHDSLRTAAIHRSASR